MTQRRFTDKPEIDPAAVSSLAASHPAIVGNSTLYPSTVVEVTKDAPDRILVSGESNMKLGKTVAKGAFKGYALYGLSLEERATCPVECDARAFCFGNAMPFARRHKIGDPEIFFDRLGAEIWERLTDATGLLIRLHVLGDFPSIDYVAFWADILEEHPKVACYGYTHRKATSWGGDEIGDAIQSLKDKYPDRFRIRWSSDVSRPDGAFIINYTPKRPRVDEGLVCPAQTDATACCASCGLCWEQGAKRDTIVFIKHGRKSLETAAEAAMGKVKVADPFADALLKAMPGARRYAVSMCRDATLADDLVQEAAAKALANRDKFETGTNFDAWFSTILRNHFIQTTRRAAREQDDPDGVLADKILSGEDTEERVIAREALDAFEGLPENMREATRDIAEGLTYEEAAAKHGVPAGTIKSRVSRGRDAFQELLEGHAPKHRSVSPAAEQIRIALTPAPKNTRSVAAVSLPSNLSPKAVTQSAPRLRTVRPTDLLIEPAYQRDLSGRSISLIRKIVAGWDWAKFKPPVCAETADGLFVIDGQHTAIAAASHPAITSIPVMVVSADLIENRADAFVAHNRDRLAMSVFQIFHAEVAAGVKEARAILDAATRAGAVIPRSPPLRGQAKPGQVIAVKELRHILGGSGNEVLERVLRIAVMAQQAPLGNTVARALRILLGTQAFAEVRRMPDSRIANGLRSIVDIEQMARHYAEETGQGKDRACAALIAEACKLPEQEAA